MNAVTKAAAKSVLRGLMIYLGAKGIDIGVPDVDIAVDALLVIGPIVWGVIDKLLVHQKLQDAQG